MEKAIQQNEGSILDVLLPIFEERMEDRKGKEEMSRQVEEGEFINFSSGMEVTVRSTRRRKGEPGEPREIREANRGLGAGRRLRVGQGAVQLTGPALREEAFKIRV